MINEYTINIGDKYIITGGPHCNLIGQIGIAKWTNYRGVCLKFPNGDGYIIPFDCLKELESKMVKQFREIPTAENVITGQFRYRLAKIPETYLSIPIALLGQIGKTCRIEWSTSGADDLCYIVFQNDGESDETYINPKCLSDGAYVNLNCLEDTGG